MPDRPRETVFICHDAETADEAATCAHNRLILSMADGEICETDFGLILADLVETCEHTGRTATGIAVYDHIVEETVSLLHNGRSRRSRRLAAERHLREARQDEYAT